MKKRLGIVLALSLVTLALASCGSSSSSKKACGGETCKVGDHRHQTYSLVIPTEAKDSRA